MPTAYSVPNLRLILLESGRSALPDPPLRRTRPHRARSCWAALKHAPLPWAHNGASWHGCSRRPDGMKVYLVTPVYTVVHRLFCSPGPAIIAGREFIFPEFSSSLPGLCYFTKCRVGSWNQQCRQVLESRPRCAHLLLGRTQWKSAGGRVI